MGLFPDERFTPNLTTLAQLAGNNERVLDQDLLP